MYFAAVCDNEYAINRDICHAVKTALPDWEVSAFLSGEDLLLCEKRFDIILLDVRMKRMSGIETAEKLRESGSDAQIIFITGIKDYVFKAFDVGAFHYLLKPINEDKLKAVLCGAAAKIAAAPQKRRLLIKTGSRFITLAAEDILYLENEMRKIAAHTLTETVEFYGAMSQTQEKLGPDFFRCHRAYLVNMAYIAEYDSSRITLSNGAYVYISKSRYPDFIKHYLRYLRGKDENNAGSV